MDDQTKICCFCGNSRLKLLHSGLYHPSKVDHGPFDFYQCLSCGSGTTFPHPSKAQLTALYSSFDGGMMSAIREIRDKYPLNAWYNQCIDHALRDFIIPSNKFHWLDVGAGNGELSVLMLDRFPESNGVALEFNESPQKFKYNPNMQWIQADINSPDFAGDADSHLIFLITVLEHVLYPDMVIEALLRRLKPGGVLYITVPDQGSLVSRILKKRWPYFLPGEHLHVPSQKGMRLLLQRLCSRVFPKTSYTIQVNPVILPYTLGYYLGYFGLKKVPDFLAEKNVRLQTGIMEANVRLA